MADDVLLETERLTLRELEEGDWEAVHRFTSDPEVVRYMPWGPNTEAQTRAFIAEAIACRKAQPRTYFELAVVRRADAQIIGACNLRITERANRGAVIGYWFRSDAWGHGYGTETVRGLLALGFGELGLHRIFAHCDPDNGASARVLEKAGLRREGLLREHEWQHGEWRDSILCAILEPEWSAGERDAAKTR
ncbi:MAG TPA: GNAT family N-acetyltransferase [Planctomycetota bacterium]|nr:GNAT family N-acetyltransferase [Planctomycetota bacterium]